MAISCRVLTSLVLATLLATLFGLPLHALASDSVSRTADVTVPQYLDVKLAITSQTNSLIPWDDLVALGTKHFGTISPDDPDHMTEWEDWGNVHTMASVTPCYVNVSRTYRSFEEGGFGTGDNRLILWMRPDHKGEDDQVEDVDAGQEPFWDFNSGRGAMLISWQLRNITPATPAGNYSEEVTFTIYSGYMPPEE